MAQYQKELHQIWMSHLVLWNLVSLALGVTQESGSSPCCSLVRSCVFENYSLSSKLGASDHLIQDWWNWSHDLWQLLTPSTKSIAALSVYPSKMNSGFLGLVFLALSPRA